MIFRNIDTAVMPKSAISELISAPEYTVKVYLLGMEGGEFSVNILAARLNVSDKVIMDALDDLNRRGLLRFINEGGEQTLEYIYEDESAVTSDMYPDAEFNKAVQSLFGDRQLTYRDMQKLYECLNLIELPKPVLLILIENAIKSHSAGRNMPVSHVVKLARRWSLDGVTNIYGAERRGTDLSGEKNVKDVLRLLGMPGKMPSSVEEELFEKWDKVWGISFGAIEAAIPQTARIQYPNMQYLDTIIKELYDNKITDAPGAREFFEGRAKADAQLKLVLEALGVHRRAITNDLRNKFAMWTKLGFEADGIVLAAKFVASRGGGGIDDLDRELYHMHKSGIRKSDAIKADMENRNVRMQRARNMLRVLGMSYDNTAVAEDAYDRFFCKYKHSDDVILFAAKCAQGSRNPLKVTDKILREWNKKGCFTLENAKAENAAHVRLGAKNSPAYEQRVYGSGIKLTDISAGEEER